MAKLYRLVPDTIATIQTTGYKTGVIEDLFYSLGYISRNNDKYLGIYREGEGITNESPTNGYFFFLNPWSCIRGLTFLNDFFCDRVAKILEYDIPDELLSDCKNAFTNYESYQAKGVMVPISILKGDEPILTELNDDLKKVLSILSFSDAVDTIEFLKETEFDIPVKLDREKLDRVNQRRLNLPISYFKSKYITGKKMLINRDFTDKMMANIFEITNKEAIDYLISKSNGILTFENALEYDGDTPDHKYGIILS